ncbi:MAG: LD-carboxypeptidase [Saprospiraceae bacterium]|nr:LD-carboxypeptidase [Saprospiraceae bacterium]
MISPDYLKKGDKIAIISTARKISPEEIEPSVKIFESWGLEVVLGENLFWEYNQFAGSDEQRTFDFQQMLDDPTVKAIICARGGYGTVKIIDNIDFTNFIKNPKWIVGYSDITVIHSHIHTKFGVETLHATMPINFPKDKLTNNAVESLRKALFGEKLKYELKLSEFSRKGIVEAEIIGGNLSILYSLIGSPSDINTEEKFLFIEDLDEYLYHIDRMMMNLKRAGKLENIAGLIVGGMSDMNDNEVPYGKTAKEIIAEIIETYNYPVLFDFPAGHIEDNRALILGRNARLSVGEIMRLEFL